MMITLWLLTFALARLVGVRASVRHAMDLALSPRPRLWWCEMDGGMALLNGAALRRYRAAGVAVRVVAKAVRVGVEA